MQEERKKILEMVANGTITVDEGERLIAALYDDSGSNKSGTANMGGKPKYLRISVEPGSDQTNQERVNIRVPINLIRAGLKWASFIPKHSQKKVDEALKNKGLNIDFSNLTPDDVDELIVNLNDLQVEVDGEEIVKIYCE